MTTEETKITKLTDFIEAAKAEAAKYGVENTDSVSVYAFYEFGKTYYVCQMAVGQDVMRAPIMHSPEAAVSAFGDSIKAAVENSNKKENSDIEI